MSFLLDQRRSLTTVAGLMFLLLLVSGYFLADTVRRQFDQQYRERLHSSLATYGVILNYTYEGMAASLHALARDGALIDAVSDGAAATAGELLRAARASEGLDAVHLADAEGRILASTTVTNGGSPDAIACFSAAGGIAVASGGVYLTRVEKVARGEALQGFLCGAVLVTPAGGAAGLRAILRGSPFMVVAGRMFQLDSALAGAAPTAAGADGELVRWRSVQGRFLGMTSPLAIGGDELTIGLLIPESDFSAALTRPLVAVGFSFVAMFALALFALRSMWRQRQTEQRLDRVNQQALVTLSSIGDSVVTTDAQGRIDFANRAVQRLLGATLSQIRGKPWERVLPLVDEAGGLLGDPVAECIGSARPVRSPGIVMLALADHRIAVKYTVAPILVDAAVSGTVIVLHDVSSEYALHRQLAWKAGHDDLTGLPNRRSFHEAVEAELERLRRGDRVSALLFLDLDRFKAVNDSCGHEAGDRLLKEVCRLFADSLRRDDLLARLGGDEFGVLLRGAGLEQAQRIAERLVRQLEGYCFDHDGRCFSVGVSVGLLTLDAGSGGLEEVLRQADSACYDAKAAGRGRVRRYPVAAAG